MLGRHGVGQVNENGMRLLTLCAEHNLIVTNTLFQQNNKYITSWMHPRSKHWPLIDYIIVRCSDANDVLLTPATRGAESWTDHRIILAKLLVSIRPLQRLQKSSKRSLDCIRLEKTAVRDEFRRSLAERLRETECRRPHGPEVGIF